MYKNNILFLYTGLDFTTLNLYRRLFIELSRNAVESQQSIEIPDTQAILDFLTRIYVTLVFFGTDSRFLAINTEVSVRFKTRGLFNSVRNRVFTSRSYWNVFPIIY